MPVRSGQERVRMYAGFIRAHIVAGRPTAARPVPKCPFPPSSTNLQERIDGLQRLQHGQPVVALHPNRHFKKDPRVFVAADGMEFTTHDGRKVIDGISSLWCVGAGHNRKPINEAIKKQLDTLDYATAFQVSNDKAFKAAEMIAAMAPGDLNKVLFCNSGSEAADTSMKVALAYHRARGEGHRNLFIGREKGYHGVGFGGMSVGGIPGNRKVFGSAFLPRVDHMRFIHDPVNHAYIHNQEPVWAEDPLADLEQRILPLHDPSNVAAIIVEPVAGSAGWYLPPKGYLQKPARDLRQARHPADLRRGHHRLRPHGHQLRVGLLRRGARHAELRQVRDQRRDPAGRRDLPRQALRRDDEHRRARARGGVLPRLHLLGPSGGLRGGHRDARPVQKEQLFRAPAKWARCWAMPSTAPSRACRT